MVVLLCSVWAGEPGFFGNGAWDDGQAVVEDQNARLSRLGIPRDGTVQLVVYAEHVDARTFVRGSTPEGSVPVLRANLMQRLPGDDGEFRQMASLAFARTDGRLLSCAFTSQDGFGTGFLSGACRDGRWTFSGQDPRGAPVSFEEKGDVVLYDALPFWLRARLGEKEVLRVQLLGTFLGADAGRPAARPAEIRFATVKAAILDRKHYPLVLTARVRQVSGEDILYFAPEFPHRLLAWRRADGGRLDAVATHTVEARLLDPASFRSGVE